ncbi:Testis-specific serine/threonine-protein kinase 3 [Tritrichomonas foetus]|uniref:Testis-specific serine/threonine-protein kinase 3 n=1 Tax=Tritrichomonas foetus TaxID=1144522 RepID=A0A1J4JGR6_9EUKA|nr:Testis-specific serine/threonine-protein kinase 3 [Tritrichomonas foetus]|eukprot:OHS97487.1 Testis-specific serine/threonine-protein kinase 3 [Tritrichomonas foetus]
MSNDQEQKLIINGYVFEKLIGEGTYSKAFKVYSLQYDKYFCAKMTEVDDSYFDEDGNPRDPELMALINLDNPNVIKVYKYFRQDSFFFLILELCECGTLIERLNSGVPLDSMSTQIIMKDIISALVACHALKIAHRDIKPSNIFIDNFGHAKVADFGLSEILASHQATVNVACGSPSYAAPEIYGDKGYDPFKADVWALGVTFYQIVFGELPWPDEITLAGPERPPLTYPTTCNPLLLDLLQQMLSLNPDDRPNMNTIFMNPFFNSGGLSAKNKKEESFIRSTISLRNVHKDLPRVQSNGQTKLMQSAAHRIRSLHPSMDRSRRSSARIIQKPLTFQENS